MLPDQLKKLVSQACATGNLTPQDKNMLEQKALEMGVPIEQLQQLINEQLALFNTDENLSSGFVSDADDNANDLSSGFETNPQDSNAPENLSSGFVTTNAEVHSTKKNPPVNPSTSHFTNVMVLDNQGAMSLVQKAQLHGKWVIVKRIKPEYKNNPTYVDLFYKEFENAYHLDHPNIIRLLDKGEDDQGAYYSMEFVDGRSLTELIKPGGVGDYKLIKRTAIQMIDALIYVHRKQVFHRDLKPDNILLTYKGNNVKILDFGLAAADSFDDNLVKVGTPKYAAPEQKTKGNQIDQRADIYAFGLILLELLTGTTDKKAIEQIENQQYRAIVEKATQENPANRFDDCDDIMPLLRNLPDTAPPKKVVTPPTPPPPPVAPPERKQEKKQVVAQQKPAKKSKSPLPIILAVVLLVVIGGAAWFFKDALLGSSTDTSDENAANNENVVDNNTENNKADNTTTLPNDNVAFDQAKFDELKKQAEKLLDEKNIVNAKKVLEEMQKMAPSDSYVSEKLAFCEKIMQHNLHKEKRNESGKFGYVDSEGYLIVDYIFERAEYFYSPHAAMVKKDGLWGFINRRGEVVEDFKYTSVRTFKSKGGVKAYKATTTDGRSVSIIPKSDGTVDVK